MAPCNARLYRNSDKSIVRTFPVPTVSGPKHSPAGLFRRSKHILAVRKKLNCRSLLAHARVCIVVIGFFTQGCFFRLAVAHELQPSGRIRGVTLAVSGDRRERLPGVKLL